MLNTNATSFRKNLFGMLEQTIKYNEPVSIRTKDGNAVLISEEDYNGMMETLYLSASSETRKQITEGLRTPLEECVPEAEVQW